VKVFGFGERVTWHDVAVVVQPLCFAIVCV
jgi:hypothetical protein